jgi:pimeloyl-ACP methyl ester carboxylesterase
MRFSTIFLAGALVLASQSALPASGPGTLTIEPTTFQPSTGEPVAAERGTLVVPMTRGARSDATQTLKFIRFRATAANAGPPIVYLAGGPGGSGIDAARGSRFPLFMALREFGDVIALDQRGTGESEPRTDCTESYAVPLAKPLERDELERALAAAMKLCFERLRTTGFDAAAYTTPESAADIDDLRKALGAERITLWAISYGTHLALATIRAYGEHVDRAILAGVEPLDHTLKLPSDQEALLEAIAAAAHDDSAIADSASDLRVTIARLLSRLRESPATVSLAHPATGEPVTVAVGALDLQLVLAEMLVGPEVFAGMPDLVLRLERGDWTALALHAVRLRMQPLPSAMSVAMDCASGASAAWLERIASEAPKALLGDAINIPFPGICAGLGIADLGDEYRRGVRSDVPVLLISGTLDGRTPPRNAETVARDFPHARHVVIEGAGHSDPLFLSSPQILEDMRAFLRDQPLPAPRIILDRPRFIPPRTVAALPDDVLSRYVGAYRISEDEVRKVVKAGSLLFTIRGDGAPFPLRPLSETRFFWEGSPQIVEFELAPDGKVRAMTVAPADARGQSERAPKIE